ncbi:unsaturated rhamnogalacturonyl hydrolase [Oribacterium sp. KHPX15]|uniref:glycoside hydrolase family 88/105 protein n=1 Tax=Oribacterium sp. KHPX15 TaxID=1855342 RepID=UPI000897B635|nr:glycoside hydrolase family 88 protein [Oribacterium sp. KHPX15]SEA54198.1 unsaturated rhamnogalacturonyl hydrolase [Oribacterium sp. KHPX15]
MKELHHLTGGREDTEKLLNDYVDYLMTHSDSGHPAWNLEVIRSGKENRWNYIDGCMITGILRLYEITGQEKYLKFADDFSSGFINDDGSIRTYDIDEKNLDNINPAKNLFKLYDITGKEKYLKAIKLVRSQIDKMPRTNEGNFWHKNIYPNQVWLDGLYMAQPFYIEYEKRFNDCKNIKDTYDQFCNVEKHMRDEKTGLYYHGYDESREMYWADPETGCSPNFWLRAEGWFIMSLVDVLEVMMDMDLPEEKEHLKKMLVDLTEALSKYQDESGLFHQLIALPEVEGNYLETSGTALISAAVLKGVRLGFIPEKYRSMAEKAFYGIIDKRLSKNDDGTPCVTGICLVAGLGGADHRDGSVGYYLSEPVVKNDAKGVGPLFLAYTEMIR